MKLKCPIIIFIAIGVQPLCQVLSGSEAEIPLIRSQAIHPAQKANTEFLACQLDIDLGKCDPVTTGLQPNPEIKLQYGALTNGHDWAQGTTLFSGENTQYALQFGLTWLLSAKRRLMIKFATQQSEIARPHVSLAGYELALEVGNKWLEVWYMKVMKDLTGAARNAIAQMVGGNEMPLKNQVSTPAGLERNQILQEQYNLQMQILMTDQANELNRLRLVTGAGIGVTIDMKDPIDAISDQLGRDPTIAGETRAFSGCFLPNVSVWLRQSINASRQSVQTEFHN